MATANEAIANQLRILLNTEPGHADMDSVRKIAIVSTPRCGSNYFCEVLRQTGCCGWPSEWFNNRYLHTWATMTRRKTIDFAQYTSWIVRRTASKNRVFSVNFHIEQYQWLLHQGVDLLKLGFDHLFYLSRRDKLAQAYSLRLAQITDQWCADQDAVATAHPEQVARSEIVKALYQIVAQEDFFEKHLRKAVDSEFEYEDFTGRDASNEFRTCLTLAGLSEGKDHVDLSTQMRPQRGSYNTAPLQALERHLLASLDE